MSANSTAVMIVAGQESACVVLDISPLGARLCVSTVRVPRAFNLRYRGHVYGCDLVWQKEMEIGVSFCDPHDDESKADTSSPTPRPKVDVRNLRSQLFGKGK
jgi:hypothetical protein